MHIDIGETQFLEAMSNSNRTLELYYIYSFYIILNKYNRFLVLQLVF